jgi:hypothetical protein
MERFTRRDYCRWEAKKEKGKDGEKMNREEKKGIGMRKRLPEKRKENLGDYM